MRFLSTLLCTLIAVQALYAQHPIGHRIAFAYNQQNIGILKSNSISFEDCFMISEDSLAADLLSGEINLLKNAGLRYVVKIHNLTEYYRTRNHLSDTKNTESTTSVDGLVPVPSGFSLGTMGGFSTHGQLMAHLDTLFSKYPALVTQKSPISPLTTHNGNQIYYVKISDNPNQNENEPSVLFTALTHAREPIGMQQMLFFMYYLVENYEIDPYIKALIDTTQIYFIPCVNPDGYIYNQQTNPAGGGLWRKNRLDHGDGNYGVDLNRNFGYMWGYDDEGSSPYTWAETYRGAAPFSEPETQALRDFVNQNNFSICLNYHSHGNLLLYPFGYQLLETPDSLTFRDYAFRMSDFNGYSTGTAGQLLYNTNGDANDWMYGDGTLHDPIISMTPEIGNSSTDGFWPTVGRIIPLCQENVPANLLTVALAGRHAVARDLSPMYLPDNQGYLKYQLIRNGMSDEGTYTVKMQSVGANPVSFGEPKVYVNPLQYDTIFDSIFYTVEPNLAQPNQPVVIALSVDNGYYSKTDTLKKIIGPALTEIFKDEGSDFHFWTSSTWNTTTFYFHSPSTSITDSPIGNYPSNASRTIELTNNLQVDHQKNPFAMLSFWTRRYIQRGRDYVVAEASSDNGISWIPLKGNHTKPGGPYQRIDAPLYDGFQDEWVKEEINLSDFEQSDNLKLRFTLISDALINRDGFWFDDLTVYTRDWYLGDDSQNLTDTKNSLFVWPNPASEYVKIALSTETDVQTIVIQSALGQRIDLLDTGRNKTISLAVSHLPQGAYMILGYNKANQVVAYKKLLIKKR